MLLSRILRQAVKSSSKSRPGEMAPKEGGGSCGILPWSPKEAPPPPPRTTPLPTHLIRPPCRPGSEPGDLQTCVGGNFGLYCPPCRKKYKYPSFSENIDFVPPGPDSCWWKVGPRCPVEEMDDGVLQNVTRRWACDDN